MVRSFVLLAFGIATAAPGLAQRAALDPVFARIPFEQWLGESNHAAFRWTASVPRPELSFHQRLEGRVVITVDGRDLQTRRANGQLVFFVQITDREGIRYQNHGSIELNKLDKNVRAANIEYAQPAFFLPGTYRLAVALLDTGTQDHSALQSEFRVAVPRHDFLPEAWRSLPPVEFIEKEESSDAWYLPEIQGQLQWASSVHSSARLNVILNVAPSVPVPGSLPTPSSGLPALIPTLKAISQTGSPALSESIELLDLARRRAVFHQADGHELDWPRLKSSLGEANSASIDIHSLSDQHHDAQFFVSAVRKLLRSAETPCVLVVLTTPLAFASEEDLTPISTEALPACRVFYIRYHAAAPFAGSFAQRREAQDREPHKRGEPLYLPDYRRQVLDELEATLKPLRPKLFDVQRPEQMTEALSEIRKTLSGSE